MPDRASRRNAERVRGLVKGLRDIDKGHLPARGQPRTERRELAILLEHLLGEAENRQYEVVEVGTDLRLHRPSGMGARPLS